VPGTLHPLGRPTSWRGGSQGSPTQDKAGAGVFPPQFSSRITSTRSTVPSAVSTTSRTRSRCRRHDGVFRLYAQVMPCRGCNSSAMPVGQEVGGIGVKALHGVGTECAPLGSPRPTPAVPLPLALAAQGRACLVADEQELPAPTALASPPAPPRSTEWVGRNESATTTGEVGEGPQQGG
jgi:hypothetical protein